MHLNDVVHRNCKCAFVHKMHLCGRLHNLFIFVNIVSLEYNCICDKLYLPWQQCNKNISSNLILWLQLMCLSFIVYTFLDESSHFHAAANVQKNNLTMGFDNLPPMCAISDHK